MNRLRVIPTWRHGQERLYVCRTDGRNVAWYDREAGRVNLLSEELREDVLAVLGPFVTGDPLRLHQLVANLLANARVHTPPGTTTTLGL
ncbi:hypothetical protein PV351_37765, partial [Streptomyces scabiei]|nr:hypothetical protein [Streptomyces scabiei]